MLTELALVWLLLLSELEVNLRSYSRQIRGLVSFPADCCARRTISCGWNFLALGSLGSTHSNLAVLARKNSRAAGLADLGALRLSRLENVNSVRALRLWVSLFELFLRPSLHRIFHLLLAF